MNISIIKNITFIIFIFVSYLAIYNYFTPIYEFLSNIQDLRGFKRNFLIPSLFSICFLFLARRKYTNIIVSLYLIFCLILISEQLNYQYLKHQTVVTYAAFIFFVAFALIAVYQILSKFGMAKTATILNMLIAFLIYIIPLISIIYILIFDGAILEETLYAVFQTNQSEAYEYIVDFVPIQYIALFALFIIIINFLIYQQRASQTPIKKVYLIIAMVVFGGIFLSKPSNFQIYDSIVFANKNYKNELQLFKDTQIKKNTNKIKFKANKKEKKEVYIVVIGESLNKKHMGIYGYLRNTTPLLSKMRNQGDITIFNQAYSAHTHTTEVLQLALTEANQYNDKTYYNSLTIIDILKKADIQTYWITNQSLYSIFDNLVSIIAQTSQHLISLNKSVGANTRTQKYDDAVIDEVKNILKQDTEKNKVIFIHLMGNHSRYASRYPKDKYSVYSSRIKQGEFGKNPHGINVINHYDNSVVYNDFVVASILKELQESSKNQVGGFFYFSDHADDVINNKGHGSGSFSYYMAQIPIVAWFSDKYQARYQEKYRTLTNNINKLYSNDMVYDTLIGMTNIKTDKYNSQYDLSSKNYQLHPKDALVLHGRKKYLDKDNHIYWQKTNAQYLLETNQASRIFPHRVNSLGKLKDIWNDGFRAFEIDVIFEHNRNNIFQVGHNEGDMGVDFEQFLSKIDTTKISRIWLDFKNLNQDNYKDALQRLNSLDKKFKLKNKLIIESDTTSDLFKYFSKDNWHTSYYLPTNKILTFLINNNEVEMKKIATEIIKQVNHQSLSAVSFDDRLYPFVKKYLEKGIPKEIVYHIWYAPPLAEVTFKEDLINNPLYLDDRIKTLLTVYKSAFDL